MNTLSPKTLGMIIEIACGARSGTQLKNMLMASELSDGNPPPFTNKAEMLRPALLDARRAAAEKGDTKAHASLLEFVRLLVDALSFGQSAELKRLEEALRSDGFELQHDGVPTRVLPNEPAVAPLNPEITAFEADLKGRGYDVALKHYQLAVKHFAEQDHPSSNGQLRSALESLVVNLAVDHTSYQDTGKGSQGGNAIKALCSPTAQPPAVLGQPLPEGDGGAMLKGIWGISHSNGSHPGLSDAHEARIRMQLVTALGQYLLRHFPV